MRIGIITTWFERGAAYVSKIYADALAAGGHTVFVYARGGEDSPSKKDPKWNEDNVTRDERYIGFKVSWGRFKKWIKKNKLECLFFNEQQDFSLVAKTKKAFADIKIGAYVDYYTEKTIPWFQIYDFVVCNTQRHLQAMNNHKQKFYVGWGTNIDIFKPSELSPKSGLVFFHSAGMSSRKGTDILVDAFIRGKLYKESKLIIHTQIPIESICNYNQNELKNYNIDIIEKTVSAPGLYYLGDIYVYPTRLDGLGLTMYEALASGLPIIVTDFPPMNEVGDLDCSSRIKVADYYCRQDAYYFPMAICDIDSLIQIMKKYINDPDLVEHQKKHAREFAEENYDINKKHMAICKCFEQSKNMSLDLKAYYSIKKHYSNNHHSLKTTLLSIRKINSFVSRFKK